MPIAVASSYGLRGREVTRAFEAGVTGFFWGALRHGGFGAALRALARRERDRLMLATVSYARHPLALRASVELARRRLGVDRLDVLVLGYLHPPVAAALRDTALALQATGAIQAVGVSSHDRRLLASLAGEPWVDVVMARYSAAHPGAEREVFPMVSARQRVITYTATRWGTLLDPARVPPGERVPTAADCYRFALSHPRVEVCLAGPRDGHELDAAIEANRQGPLAPAELDWMCRVGAAVRDGARMPAPRGDTLRRAAGALRSLVTHGVTEDVLSRFNR